MGIRSKLVLCLLAVMLPVAAVGIFASHLVDKQLRERSSSALANTQHLESERIEQVLSEYARSARALASDLELRDALSQSMSEQLHKSDNANHFPVDVASYARHVGSSDNNASEPLSESLQPVAAALQREAATLRSSIVELQIVNSHGQIVGQTDGFSWTPSDNQLVSRAISTVKTQFGDAFVNPQNKQRLGTVSPVIGHSGMIVGVLIAEAQLEPVIGMLGKYESMGETIEAHIAQPTIEGDAQFITPLRFARSAAFNKIVKSAQRTPITQALHSAETQVIRAKDYRGIDSYFALKTVADTGWGLVVKIDVAEAHAPVKELRRWLLLATFASLGFIVLIYTFLLVPIVGRLDKAAQAARHIMKGDLSVRLTDNRNDEISELAYSINSLANDLKADQLLRSQVETQLRYQALHDELTGLFNRKYANTALARLSEDVGQTHSVMFLDLNEFKEVNDRFGHAAGDTVLKLLAQRLMDNVPACATVARWGGDEFVVILPGADESEASQLAKVLHQRVFAQALVTNEGKHTISCSIGLATSSSSSTLDQALVEADALMYEQKKKQRAQRTKGSLATQRIERAIKERRIEMRYQPIIRRTPSGPSVSVGADTSLFVRSNQGGHAIAEKLICKVTSTEVQRGLDDCHLTLALNSLHRWNVAGIVDSNFRLAIKLSDQSLANPEFPQLLDKKLKLMDVNPGQLQIEIPAYIESVNNKIFRDLQNIGVLLGIDIAHCESALIPKSLTNKPTICVVGQPWQFEGSKLSNLVRICEIRKIDILARGVDATRELSNLQTMGASHFQGNLFGPALKAVDFVGCWTIAPASSAQRKNRMMSLENAC